MTSPLQDVGPVYEKTLRPSAPEWIRTRRTDPGGGRGGPGRTVGKNSPDVPGNTDYRGEGKKGCDWWGWGGASSNGRTKD